MTTPRRTELIIGFIGLALLVIGFVDMRPVVRWVGVLGILVALALHLVLRRADRR